MGLDKEMGVLQLTNLSDQDLDWCQCRHGQLSAGVIFVRWPGLRVDHLNKTNNDAHTNKEQHTIRDFDLTPMSKEHFAEVIVHP